MKLSLPTQAVLGLCNSIKNKGKCGPGVLCSNNKFNNKFLGLDRCITEPYTSTMTPWMENCSNGDLSYGSGTQPSQGNDF